ncbi:MAG: NAD-dependent epimerase/dehydratase family protein [Candidatus Gastranaerophilales bacterium]|nr:NAD-dependent epimerase/dehydratase family protein [Candidatus Gastranaerophilales bacterium]
MDKILITGCAGFIGSNLANYLIKNEKNFIYGVDNFSHSTMSNLYPLLKNENFEFVEHDLKSDLNFCVDCVYHLAGNGDFSAYFNDKYQFILDKIEIFKNIVEYCIKCGAKLVFTSNFQEYSDDNEFLEYYNCIKLIENLALELIKNNKLNCNIVRLASVYGENMLKDDNRFIPQIILKAFNNEVIDFEYDEANCFTYIQDVVQILEKAMIKFNEKPILNAYNPNTYLKSDVARLIVSYLKSDSKIDLKTTITKPCYLNLSNFPIDFECKTNVLDGILNTTKHFKLMYFS